MTNTSDFSLDNELEETADWDDADALADGETGYDDEDPEEQTLGAMELAERHALRRVASLRTELEELRQAYG